MLWQDGVYRNAANKGESVHAALPVGGWCFVGDEQRVSKFALNDGGAAAGSTRLGWVSSLAWSPELRALLVTAGGFAGSSTHVLQPTTMATLVTLADPAGQLRRVGPAGAADDGDGAGAWWVAFAGGHTTRGCLVARAGGAAAEWLQVAAVPGAPPLPQPRQGAYRLRWSPGGRLLVQYARQEGCVVRRLQ